MGKLTLLLLGIISWLQYSLWFGKNGVRDLIRIQTDIIEQQSCNVKLTERNKHLFAEINDLNSDEEAIEERSRIELSMIKIGETFYRLVVNQ